MEEEILNPEEEVVIPKRGFAVCRNVQKYKDLNATINAAKGYPNHSNGTDRYSEEEPYLYVDGLPAMFIESNTTEIVGEEAVEDTVQLEPNWNDFIGVEIEKDKKVVYNGKLYKVNQTHTPQLDWTPDATEALYSEVDFDGEINEWRPVTGAHNTYGMGAQCLWNGVVHTSLIDNNAYPPSYTAYWEAEGNGDTYPVWVKPTGSHNAYKVGDIVWFPDEQGQLWISTIAANVWQPGVYGWKIYEI